MVWCFHHQRTQAGSSFSGVDSSAAGRTSTIGSHAGPNQSPIHILPSKIDAQALREYTREEGKRYLDDVVNQITRKPARIPQLNFQPEDKATEEEKARITKARQAALADGKILIVARTADGTLRFAVIPKNIPREVRERVPPHIRANLTEEDWEAFEEKVDMVYFLSIFGQFDYPESKTPKAPVQTATSVTPAADAPVSPAAAAAQL